VDRGIYARPIDTHPDITATTARNKHTSQKMRHSYVPQF
jgi:hypothetical protein